MSDIQKIDRWKENADHIMRMFDQRLTELENRLTEQAEEHSRKIAEDYSVCPDCKRLESENAELKAEIDKYKRLVEAVDRIKDGERFDVSVWNSLKEGKI